MIEVTALTRTYGGLHAVDHVSFTAEPGRKDYSRNSILTMQKNAIHTGRQTISVVVDHAPKFAGVDPYNKHVDRNSEDNVIGVE